MLDEELAFKLQAELEEEDRLVRQREEETNIVLWDNVQAMIDVDYQMAQQMQAEEQEKEVDMKGVLRESAEHSLGLNQYATPLKQKKRSLSLEKNL
ncbi:hypothetical protein Tco_0790549 [Tanacetum coccineum]